MARNTATSSRTGERVPGQPAAPQRRAARTLATIPREHRHLTERRTCHPDGTSTRLWAHGHLDGTRINLSATTSFDD